MTTTNNLKFFNMLKKGDQKLINAWAFYDWANSVYSLVISTAVFPLYYSAIAEGKVVSFLWMEWDHPDSLYSYALSFSFLVVAFISPILSGIADYTGSKKKFMKFFCWLGALSVMSLYFFEGVDTVWIGILFTILASIGFWASLVFYNAYLPEVAHPEQQDRASAKGFMYGYFGSVLLLILNLLMIQKPDWLEYPQEWPLEFPLYLLDFGGLVLLKSLLDVYQMIFFIKNQKKIIYGKVLES